eukprot:TRINITY_DN1363_c0_g2_i1.p2 TRINITY_DN1363_c0_g2~~TRINITY_DN1363_c0_g2_i1.p2  ORF type:complete len:312 (+),score=82.47 TRINITY_DN1363_c0_g2_i1:64-999(+)
MSKLLPRLLAGVLACVGFRTLSPALVGFWGKKEAKTSSAQAVDAADALFSWLGWAPEPDSGCYESLRENYPGSLPDFAVAERVKETLRPLGFNQENTIYSESICADEICHDEMQLTRLLTQHWGNVFTLGGIGGFAHGGPVALGAFKGHVPEGGNMFILYGPHVGITEGGQVGSIVRIGQKKPTTACGALMAVYNNCLKGATVDAYSPADLQARLLHEELCPRADEIKKSKNPAAMLPRVAFDVVHRQIQDMTKGIELNGGSLVLLGGIMINTPYTIQDHFLPMHFSITTGEETQDLMDAFDVSAAEKLLM